jgi:multiple sugar transport system permease protein
LISFQDYSLATGGTWVAPIYTNYVQAFSMLGGIFVTAIRNTVIYTVFTVTTNILVGLILASLIQPLSNQLRTFFRAAYYLPAVTSALIVGMTWAYIFNAQWGFANYLLRLLGLPPVRWLSDPDLAFDHVNDPGHRGRPLQRGHGQRAERVPRGGGA